MEISLPSYDLLYDISKKHWMHIENILPVSKNFLWLTEQNEIIKDMTDLVNVLQVGQLKVTTNKMSIIARGNAMEDISVNLCIGTKKHLGVAGLT